MADFSFSFDSDNPFAEPQTASPAVPPPVPDAKKSEAPQSQSAAAPEDAPTNSNSEATDDEFSLDAFDFAFDEGASTNDSLPTQTMPIEPSAPRPKTPGEAALADFDFGAPKETAPEETPIEEVAPTADLVENQDEIRIEPTAKPAKNAPNDLAEFNAINFDLDGPAGDESLAEPAGEVAEELAVAPSNSSDFLLDLDDFGNEAEPALAGPALASDELPIDELSIEEAQIATEINVPKGVVEGTMASAFDLRQDETQTAEAARPRRLKTTLSVAILGASGIGKNHARWFHRNGCRVVAFLGTSGDSTAQTQADLVSDFPFNGTAYTDLSELLAQEKPDIVCVATPPPLHFGHVLQSLESGAHVLCEKPLVYAPTRKFRENRDGAKELVKVAAKKNLVLGTQLQYGAATPILCKLAGLSPTDVGDFAMELETLNANSSREPRELWIDMGPHPISVAQMLAGPGAKLAEETVRFEPYQDEDKTEVLARFGINCADGRLLMVRAVVRSLRDSQRDAQRQPRRRFSFNGHSVIYAPLVGTKGNFQAQFIAPDGYSSVYADPVDYLVGDFVRACREGNAPLISGDFGRENLEWMLRVAGDK